MLHYVKRIKIFSGGGIYMLILEKNVSDFKVCLFGSDYVSP